MSHANRITPQQFLKEVSGHQMTILRNDGIYRHIRFQAPNTSVLFFDLITWPGNLCIKGDMGTYVFSRVQNMFSFFRSEKVVNEDSAESPHLRIDPRYWAEKCVAQDHHMGIEEYCPEKFRENILYRLESHPRKDEMREEVENEVLSKADEGEEAARTAAKEFCYQGDYPFSDFWEANNKVFTHWFLWCCYAIAWGIQVYDQRGEQGG